MSPECEVVAEYDGMQSAYRLASSRTQFPINAKEKNKSTRFGNNNTLKKPAGFRFDARHKKGQNIVAQWNNCSKDLVKRIIMAFSSLLTAVSQARRKERERERETSVGP